MPFTPFHLGPALLIGLFLRDRIDLPTFLAASVIIDFRAAMVLFGVLERPLHGFFHTFAFSSVVGIGLAYFAYRSRNYSEIFLKTLKLEKTELFKKYVYAGIAGVWTHITLDSFLYTDIQPFFPFSYNPFLEAISVPSSAIYRVCILSMILGIVYYFQLIIQGKKF